MEEVKKHVIHSKDVIARMAADIDAKNAKEAEEKKRKSFLEEVAALSTEEMNQLRNTLFGGTQEPTQEPAQEPSQEPAQEAIQESLELPQ